MNGKIFIIEDEPSIIQLVQHNLEKNGFIVSSSVNGNDGLKELKKFQPDLLLLDWMLPDLSGIEICKNIRKDNSIKNLPVIMLTAKGEEEDKIKGLDSGVDDYLTKPFDLEELWLRCNALTNRYQQPQENVLAIGPLRLNQQTLQAERDGKLLQLQPIPWQILSTLMQAHPRVVSRSELCDKIWGDEYTESDALRSHLYQLRKTIDKPFEHPIIKTIHGIGFSLDII